MKLNRLGKIRAFVLLQAIGVLLLLSSCSSGLSGELTGVKNRRPWYHAQPYGMVFIPAGSFHMGSAEQDVLFSMNDKPKQVSVQAFFMDDTEITNNEYRQFVYWVRDSIVARTYGQEPYMLTDDQGNMRIDWQYASDIDYEDEELVNSISSMYYPDAEQLGFTKAMDPTKFIYEYKRFNINEAAKAENIYTLTNKKPAKKRSQFISVEKTPIYPDTLVWVRDFAYSYNDPMAQTYFYHPGYDDYPVVGVSWHQANAFSWWRTMYYNKYQVENYDPEVNPFRLPMEAEWEYAARGGRRFNPYPWGGPYTRNSKGCFLMNFKPLRGNYPADGGFYPVRATSYFPNDYGLYNMAGNVAEWTYSDYDQAAYSYEHDMNPNYDMRRNLNDKTLSPSLTRKVIRGGSWKDVAHFCKTSTRAYEYADTAKSYVGFRCAITYMGRSIKDRAF
jgi:gliding motility-associated lipoprotein GldK